MFRLILVLGFLGLTAYSFQSCKAEMNLSKTALVIVDVQNDFCAGGTVAAPHGDDVIPAINHLRSKLNFGKVLFTMDWHPPNHVSFFERFKDKSLHPNARLNEDYTFDLGDGRGKRSQILWPTHCVQNTTGAALRVGIRKEDGDIIVYKGTHPEIDSYSGFWDNDGQTETEMDSVLKANGIEELVVTGLALDYCVGNTAKDGVKKGYKVTVVADATGAINPYGREEYISRLVKGGVSVLTTSQLVNALESKESLACPSCACAYCDCDRSVTTRMSGTAGTEGNGKTEATYEAHDACHCAGCTCPTCDHH